MLIVSNWSSLLASRLCLRQRKLVSIRKLWVDTMQFSYGKRAIFPKVKEIKRLRGGVAVYAVQASVRIDAEIGEKGRFWMKASYVTNCPKNPRRRNRHPRR